MRYIPDHEDWIIADSRDGREVGHAHFLYEWQAQAQIDGWVARDGHGGRPDIHHLIPFMVAVLVPNLVTNSESEGK